MHPYNKSQVWTKGLSSRRKSRISAHRKRCLRVNKRAARQESRTSIFLRLVQLDLEEQMAQAEYLLEDR